MPDPIADGASDQVRVTVAVALASVISTMPAFLVGAAAVLIRPELGLGEAALGAAISLFFATAAVTSVAGGRLAERFGAGRTIAASALLSGVAMLGIALAPPARATLFLLLAVAGVAHGTTQPATNLALSGASTDGRQAFRFGIKQSAVPVASLFAGVSVPVVGSTLGWRWAFGIAGIAAGSLAATIARQRRAGGPRPTRQATPRSSAAPDIGRAPMVALAIAGGLGASAATALPSFLTETAVRAGLPVSRAGWLLAAGSLAGIVARLAVGWLAGSAGSAALRTVAGMLIVGAGGYGLIAAGSTWAVTAGTLVAFALAWGWTGLFHFAVVALNPGTPGSSSGIGQAGASAGAAVGPFLFGAVAAISSFRAAWAVAMFMALFAGAATLAVRAWVAARARTELVTTSTGGS